MSILSQCVSVMVSQRGSAATVLSGPPSRGRGVQNRHVSPRVSLLSHPIPFLRACQDIQKTANKVGFSGLQQHAGAVRRAREKIFGRCLDFYFSPYYILFVRDEYRNITIRLSSRSHRTSARRAIDRSRISACSRIVLGHRRKLRRHISDKELQDQFLHPARFF